ncbi:hypothetical protein ACFQH9_31305, partial [Pseudonocardia lutea]
PDRRGGGRHEVAAGERELGRTHAARTAGRQGDAPSDAPSDAPPGRSGRARQEGIRPAQQARRAGRRALPEHVGRGAR